MQRGNLLCGKGGTEGGGVPYLELACERRCYMSALDVHFKASMCLFPLRFDVRSCAGVVCVAFGRFIDLT